MKSSTPKTATEKQTTLDDKILSTKRPEIHSKAHKHTLTPKLSVLKSKRKKLEKEEEESNEEN